VSRGGEARAAVEEDFHHFRVTLRHDGREVTHVTGDTLRGPYPLCSAAGARLKELCGKEISADLPKLTRHIDARSQCTQAATRACYPWLLGAAGGAAPAGVPQQGDHARL